MTQLPNDQDGRPIPVLGLRRGSGAHQISFSGTSARNSTAFNDDTRAISIYATANCYIELGETTGVTATSSTHFLPAETRLDIDIGGGKQTQAKYIAALQVTASGTLYVSELE